MPLKPWSYLRDIVEAEQVLEGPTATFNTFLAQVRCRNRGCRFVFLIFVAKFLPAMASRVGGPLFGVLVGLGRAAMASRCGSVHVPRVSMLLTNKPGAAVGGGSHRVA
jgi:hypothetical protein